MKKLSLTGLLFFSLIIASFPQSNSNLKPFTLTGKIIGENSDRIVLRYCSEDSKLVQDTVSIKNGAFVFKGNITEPTKAYLIGKNDLNSVQIYLEPGTMKITLTKDKFEECKMTGSKSQLELGLLNELEKPINTKSYLLKAQRVKIEDSIKNTSVDSIKHQLEKREEEIDNRWMQNREYLNSIWLQFVLDHPKSYVTANYLNMLESNEVITLDSLKSIFNKLDSSIRNSKYGKLIQDDIRKKENSIAGVNAPDFKAIDILTNQPVTYSEFKGKDVVLIDFWASYCRPCREGIPHLKSLYQKYHSKGFEIIAVSLDWTKKYWISAIKQDSLEMWHHVWMAERYTDGQAYYTKDDIYENYCVHPIPVQILIDKAGKIVERWGGNKIDNEKELDEQLAKLFKEN